MAKTEKSLPLLRIFIGEPIQHRSELDCLKEVCEVLTRAGRWAYIFANFHAAGRQIDLVVFTEHSTAVIEAKGYFHPVRGGTNGQWEQLGPYGVRKIGNAYSQAWNARLALRDEIQRGHPVDGYPNGFVIVTPGIPEGSEISSDFKVTIAGLDSLKHELSRPSGTLMTPARCQELAKQLGLEPVSSPTAAMDLQALEVERTYNNYADAFRTFYEPVASALIADKYSCDEARLGPAEARLLVTASNSTILIRGPSGCGKTLLATSSAISCLRSGDVPLFVAGRNFEGDFQKLLDKEVALLGVGSARSLVRAAKLLNKRIVLFLDGYNECQQDFQLSLTRSLWAFAVRNGASVVVSTQHELVRQNLLTIQTILVSHPSAELKACLADVKRSAAGTENLQSLLRVANSGLEATLIGQVGTALQVGASRFRLFDTYARTKLGKSASEGVRILSAFADALITKACFSLSIREFDRLCDGQNLTQLDRVQLSKSGLLDLRGDRVSFIHELFFSAYSAEAAIRSAREEVQEILAMLASPRHHASKKFIIGALEDDLILHQVIDEIEDHDLLYACSTGECGLTAQSITSNKIAAMLDAMVLEAKDLEFRIVGEGWHAVEMSPGTQHVELRNFDAYICAIGDALMSGRHLEPVLSACRYADEAIARFTEANVAEAKSKKIPLKHDTFSAAYVMHRGAAISQLVNFVHSGGLSFRRQEGRGFSLAIHDAWQLARTPGEFYFLIGLTKFTEQHKKTVPHVVRLLQNVRNHPYHLQLDLIDFSGHFRDADDSYRTQIIEALQAALNKLGVMMNTVIFEALSGLGALDEEEENHIPVIREEIQSALSCDSEESNSEAWGIFSRQFDHPFDSAYWEEIQGLDEASKKRLLTKACRGAQVPYISFVGILIRQLAEFNDLCVAPEIMRWTSLPDKTSCMPQGAVEVFFNAHEALGRLGVALPTSHVGETEADDALLACGRLFYWANRADAKDLETSPNTLPAQLVLRQNCRQSGAGALQLTVSSMLSADGTHASLVRNYPNLAADVCRKALACREEQVSYFEHGFKSDQDSIACFAIQVLGECGTQADATMLRGFCDHQVLGTASLGAIRNIEQRHR